MINIAEILKEYHVGTELWSNVIGDCTLSSINPGDGKIEVYKKEKPYFFSLYGEMHRGSGLCNLFPSKEMQDWEKLAWKRGDVLKDCYGIECMFDGWIEDDFTKFLSIYSITTDPSNENTFYEDQIFSTKEYCKVAVKAQSQFIKNLEEKYGGTFNLETLEIEKPKPTYEDGDFVYTKVKCGYEVISIFKEFSKQNRFLTYADFFLDNKSIEFADRCNENTYLCDWNEVTETRLATEEEKQIFLSSLERVGKNWNPQTKRIENPPKAHEFKPFQKVLVRDSNTEKWGADFFSYYEEDTEYSYMCTACGFRQCIPYEGNEHLLGTTDEWKGCEG